VEANGVAGQVSVRRDDALGSVASGSASLIVCNPPFHSGAAVHAGAAVLFLSAIGAYKAALRSAYIKIAFGIVLVGGGLAQVVFLNIFGLIQTPWVQYGGVMLPFVIAGLAIYFGTRSYGALRSG